MEPISSISIGWPSVKRLDDENVSYKTCCTQVNRKGEKGLIITTQNERELKVYVCVCANYLIGITDTDKVYSQSAREFTLGKERENPHINERTSQESCHPSISPGSFTFVLTDNPGHLCTILCV